MKLKKDVIINGIQPESIDWHKTFSWIIFIKKVNPLRF